MAWCLGQAARDQKGKRRQGVSSRQSERTAAGEGLIASFFTLSSSHQIFGHMYGVLNVDKKITNYTV